MLCSAGSLHSKDDTVKYLEIRKVFWQMRKKGQDFLKYCSVSSDNTSVVYFVVSVDSLVSQS